MMADMDCPGCAAERKSDPALGLARLQRRNEQLASVLSRFMATVVDTSHGARADAFEQRSLLVDELNRELERIVGGRTTTDYENCCLVGHRNPNGTIGWFCSGVLVNPRIVLTAGHCFLPANQPNVVALNTPDQNALQNAEIIDVRRAVVNPRYIQTHQISDMTVLILRTDAATSPARIATTDELAAGKEVTLVGFGNQDIAATQGFGTKREVKVDIASIRRAAADNLDADEQRFGYESDYEFVAGGNGFDSCTGDSGGPAYLMVGDTPCAAGLTSRATHGSTHACGDGGIYTRVDVHRDFIAHVAADAGIVFPV